MYEKLKSFIANDAFFTVSLILLVGITSFGLGRMSVVENVKSESVSQAGIIFSGADVTQNNSLKSISITAERVVASKSGTKYHLLTCPGASQIKEENKLFFDSVELAEAAGFQPAANCQGI